MNIVCVDPKTDPLWQELIREHRSDVFHSPAWLQVLAGTYDLDTRALILLDEAGQPRAGLAYCPIEDMRPARNVSLPFSDYCDPLVNDSDEWYRLIEPLVAQGHPIALRCLHNSVPLHDKRFPLVNRARWHGLDLQPDLDSLWAGLEGSARRAIKKAQRDGVIVRMAEGEEDLRAFFELHLRVRKYKYRLVAQPYRFFENIWNQFLAGGSGALMLAAHEGEIIGGVLFLEWQNTLYYKFNASNLHRVEVRPNDLVVWEGIQYGKSKGLTTLDFGLSDWDQEGLVAYKRKFASDERTISFLKCEPNGGPTQQEKQVRDLLNHLTDLFVNESVPDRVTEEAGEVVYRYFT
jgi:CelD/BcsL family acetyltransferase involved in cellulose biosynthesis